MVVGADVVVVVLGATVVAVVDAARSAASQRTLQGKQERISVECDGC